MKAVHRVLSALAALFFSFAPGWVMAAQDEADFYRHVAEQYILAQFPQKQGVRAVATAARLDAHRDYGGRCEGYLTAELVGSDIRTNSQVRLSCRKPDFTFTLTVPVTVRLQRQALVAVTDIPRGTVVTESMLETEWVNESTADINAVSDKSEIVGCQIKKEVKRGEQIKQNNFCMVCKGSEVTLIAQKGGLSLKIQGQAVTDGNLNQTVQVRNLKSNKVVSGKVCGPACVQVLL